MKIHQQHIPKTKCFHCGDDCDSTGILSGDKRFCCIGCKTVYEILNKNGLCDYYSYNEAPGAKNKSPRSAEKFAFLDTRELAAEFVEFSNSAEIHLRFY